MARQLPWGLVILGAVLAVVMQLCGVSALAFAVGVYLPLSTTLPIFVGGALRGLVDRARRFTPEEAETSPGTLMSTGLIAGGSLAGIIVALSVVAERRSVQTSLEYLGPRISEFGLLVFDKLVEVLNFLSKDASGGPRFDVSAIHAFAVMAAVLLAVALLGKRPASGTPDQGERARLGEIGADDQ
jgi:hypothetical protein